jgi:serine protease Do
MIYVQTDASINHGSSGGPLVDLQGRIVGINTLILSQAGGDEGLGFAAPSNIVRTVYEQIRKNGRVRRGDIGIRAQTITPTMARGLSLPRDYGVVLADVAPRSPAARAGLRRGDLVLALDGKPMENGRQLQVGLYRRFVGDVVSFEVLRNGERVTLPVTMLERRDPFSNVPHAVDPRANMVRRLGILGVTLDQRLAEVLPASRVSAGVVVVSTVDGAIDSREGGLAEGDVVFAVNRTPISDLVSLRTTLDGLSPGDPVVLHLERQGTLMYLTFTVD